MARPCTQVSVSRCRLASCFEGIRLAVPLAPALIPFGAIYATLALDAGFYPWQVLLASATIIAGASQYAMLDLLGQHVPLWSILLAVVAINARHVLYSAAIGRGLAHFGAVQRALAFFLLTDPAYASAEQRLRSLTPLTPGFYFAYAASIYAFWLIGNLLGLWVGDLIGDPARFGLDFILPVYFLSLIVGFRQCDRFVLIAVVSVGASIGLWTTLGAPWHILLGGIAGLLVAAASARQTPVAARPAPQGDVHA